MESFEKGWPAFFDILRIYLVHFAGQKSASLHVLSTTKGDHLATWKQLINKLSLTTADVGETRTTAQEPESLSGVIERVHQDSTQRFLLMRLTSPVSGVAMIGTYSTDEYVNVSVALFLYGDTAETLAVESEQKWREWLGKTFPAAV